MTAALIVPLPGSEAMARLLCASLGAELSPLAVHRFPDGESLLRFEVPLAGRDVVLVSSLDRPDPKIVPLLFAAGTARELAARSIGLVAPYLGYMRQDKAFAPGQSVSAKRLADLLTPAFDWLVTVDPHLHRIRSLSELYAIPARAIPSAPAIAAWIAREVSAPFIIGPDSESVQWVSGVARLAGAPYAVWRKTRSGDEDVTVSGTEAPVSAAQTPVLIDDIISSGQTMANAISLIASRGLAAPVCVGVHAVFAEGAETLLMRAGAARLITTNTIAHRTNAIDVHGGIADAIAALAGPARSH